MMQKTCHSPRYRAVMVALLLVSPTLVQADQPSNAPQIDAKAWILMDYNSGKVLAESNADDRLDPASLTKNDDQLCCRAGIKVRQNQIHRYGFDWSGCLGDWKSSVTWFFFDVSEAR